MNDDVIADLKQFIAATISQQSSSLREDIVGTLREDIEKLDDKLSGKIDDLSSSVAEALDSHSEAMQPQLDEHDRRITRLETRVA